MHLKISLDKCKTFCSGLNVLSKTTTYQAWMINCDIIDEVYPDNSALRATSKSDKWDNLVH